jgi:hypothetical protein
MARPVPTSRASRCVPPAPGRTDSVVSGSPNDPDVARHRQLAAAPEREPVDGRDRRFREGLDDVEGPLHLRREPGVQVVVTQLGDVRAGDEGLVARAGEGDEPDVVALAQVGQHVAELGQHLPAQGVADLGTVDRDDGEPVVDLDRERLHHAPPKAAMPVIARPMIRVWTSSVPS